MLRKGVKEDLGSGAGGGVEPWAMAGEVAGFEDTGDETATGINEVLWNGRYRETAIGAVKEEMDGEGAAGIEVEAWFGAKTEVELMPGKRTGDGMAAGLVSGTDAGEGLKPDTDDGGGAASVAAAGF